MVAWSTIMCRGNDGSLGNFFGVIYLVMAVATITIGVAMMFVTSPSCCNVHPLHIQRALNL
jgi:hypothetical protein